MSAAVIAVGFAIVLPRCLGSANGADVELAAALKATEPEGLHVTIPGSSTTLISARHSFSRVTLPLNDGARQGHLVATLDFTGQWGRVKVASLGREDVALRKEDGRWVPTDGWAPRLARAIGLLERRRAALEHGDANALKALAPNAFQEAEVQVLWALRDRTYRVEAWYLRFERDEVLVSETYRLTGLSPDRPIDEHGTRRLRLVSQGDEFSFSPPLM